MKRRVFGFDLGIASIGWAVVDFDNEYYDMDTGEILEEKVKGSGEIAQGKIVACGVRSFPVAENPKDGSSLAAAQHEKPAAKRGCAVYLLPKVWLTMQKPLRKKFASSRLAVMFGICV